MAKSRAKICILSCGIAIFTAPTLCYAQETWTLPEVNKPQTVVSPVFLPKIVDTPSTIPPEAKPSKEASELPWYWRFLGWLAMDYARYNTEKQSDGRPQQLGKFR